MIGEGYRVRPRVSKRGRLFQSVPMFCGRPVSQAFQVRYSFGTQSPSQCLDHVNYLGVVREQTEKDAITITHPLRYSLV